VRPQGTTDVHPSAPPGFENYPPQPDVFAQLQRMQAEIQRLQSGQPQPSQPPPLLTMPDTPSTSRQQQPQFSSQYSVHDDSFLQRSQSQVLHRTPEKHSTPVEWQSAQNLTLGCDVTRVTDASVSQSQIPVAANVDVTHDVWANTGEPPASNIAKPPASATGKQPAAGKKGKPPGSKKGKAPAKDAGKPAASEITAEFSESEEETEASRHLQQSIDRVASGMEHTSGLKVQLHAKKKEAKKITQKPKKAQKLVPKVKDATQVKPDTAAAKEKKTRSGVDPVTKKKVAPGVQPEEPEPKTVKKTEKKQKKKGDAVSQSKHKKKKATEAKCDTDEEAVIPQLPVSVPKREQLKTVQILQRQYEHFQRR